MTFEEYLTTKKINIEKFRNSEPKRFDEWQSLFAQMHPESFTSHKKFLINATRRAYQIER